MKILYDHQMFAIQKFGGISRIFIELMRELSLSSECSLAWYRGWHLDGYDISDYRSQLWRYWSFPWVNNSQLNSTFFKLFNWQKKYDIYHPTYYDASLLQEVKYYKLAITVHDLILEKFLNNLERFQPQIRDKKILVEKADLVFVNSLNTKKDLVEILNIEESKIVLTPWATRINTVIPSNTPEKAQGKPYFLYVGTRSKYKNFPILVKAFAQDTWLAKNFNVICFGGTSNFTPPEQELINENNLGNNFIYLAGDDSLLKRLYLDAQALVYTSRYEGFGLPLLEAMVCNCPVICCPVSSLPEVVGDAAIYFESDVVESLITSLKLVVENENQRQIILAKGQERAKLFSWQKTAQLTLAGYQSL